MCVSVHESYIIVLEAFAWVLATIVIGSRSMGYGRVPCPCELRHVSSYNLGTLIQLCSLGTRDQVEPPGAKRGDIHMYENPFSDIFPKTRSQNFAIARAAGNNVDSEMLRFA